MKMEMLLNLFIIFSFSLQGNMNFFKNFRDSLKSMNHVNFPKINELIS